MEKQKDDIKVLSVVDCLDNGGAGRAASRIQRGINTMQSNVKSLVFCKELSFADDDQIPLAIFRPTSKIFSALDWVAQKLENKIQHLRWQPYKKTQDASYKSDLRGSWLNGALKKQDFDILHLHWINKRFIKIKDLPTNKPIVWTLHDTWPFCGVCHYFGECENFIHECGRCPVLGSSSSNDLSHRVWKQKETVYRNLDLHIVAPSNWMADCARRSKLFKSLDIRVIPNCVDTDLFSPQGKLSRSYILYGAANAARDERKGFRYLVDALTILQTRDAGIPQLVVFGANEGEIDLPEGLNVHFLGFVSDSHRLVDIYNGALVMVVPSLNENLSCAIMEALSCGTPVCCFDIGGNSDLVSHKENGYLAKEKDSQDLADGIKWCLTHNESNILGESARKSVLEKYTAEKVCGQYIDLYKELLK